MMQCDTPIETISASRKTMVTRTLHFEKLSGNRSHQRSIRLNKQFRLVFEIRVDADGKLIVVVEVVDYH